MRDKVRVPLLNDKGNLRFYEVSLGVVREIERTIRGVSSRYYVTTNKNLDYEKLERRTLASTFEEALRKGYRGKSTDNEGRDYVVYVVGIVDSGFDVIGCHNLNDLGFLELEAKNKVGGNEKSSDIEELEEASQLLEGIEEPKKKAPKQKKAKDITIEEEVTEGKGKSDFIDTLNYRRNGVFSFDITEPVNFTNEELASEYDKFQKLQRVLKDTSTVEKKDRKYLDYVTDASDVFVDKENYDEEVVQKVTSVVSQGFLPYQYERSGDMVLNPNGGVLVSSLSRFGISGLEEYTDRYVSVISAVLLGLLMRGQEVHTYNWGAVAMVALTRGLDKNVLYPFVKKDKYKSEDFTKVCSCSNEVLYREFRNTLIGEPVRDVEVLGLVISTIIDLDLFNTSTLGFPSLRDMVTRYELSTIIEGV
jgi:hypothetical protein